MQTWLCIKDRETITNSTNQVRNPSTNHIHYTLYNIQYIMAIAVSCINYWLSTHQWCMYLVFINDISHQCCMYLVFISDLIYQCCIFYNRLISATSAVPCILDLSQPPVLSLVFWIDLSHQCCLLHSVLLQSFIYSPALLNICANLKSVCGKLETYLSNSHEETWWVSLHICSLKYVKIWKILTLNSV